MEFNRGDSRANRNWNNRSNGLSVRLVKDYLNLKIMINKETLLQDLFLAYYDARKNKRNKQTQLEFEINLESNLLSLYEELIN
jgi:hypothetical protein